MSKTTHELQALLDTGSPVSLIKCSYVGDSLSDKNRLVTYRSRVLKVPKLRVLETYATHIWLNNVKVLISFQVVPERKTSYATLLAVGFFPLPPLDINLGNIVSVKLKSECVNIEKVHVEDELELEVKALLVIEIDDVNQDINVNPDISSHYKNTISKMYSDFRKPNNVTVPETKLKMQIQNRFIIIQDVCPTMRRAK